MLNRILGAALVAGLVGGLATAALQHFTTTPLILAAEAYEGGAPAAVAPAQLDGATFDGARLVLVHGGDHAEDGEEAWAPVDGIERTLYTSVATIGTAFGFALILLSAMIQIGRASCRERVCQ